MSPAGTPHPRRGWAAPPRSSGEWHGRLRDRNGKRRPLERHRDLADGAVFRRVDLRPRVLEARRKDRRHHLEARQRRGLPRLLLERGIRGQHLSPPGALGLARSPVRTNPIAPPASSAAITPPLTMSRLECSLSRIVECSFLGPGNLHPGRLRVSCHVPGVHCRAVPDRRAKASDAANDSHLVLRALTLRQVTVGDLIEAS